MGRTPGCKDSSEDIILFLGFAQRTMHLIAVQLVIGQQSHGKQWLEGEGTSSGMGLVSGEV